MATITYTDRASGAPTISWHGREFTTLVPVEVDPEKDAALIAAAKENAFFAVEDGGEAPKYDDTIVGRGEAAARDGKKRVLPPAYRGDDKRSQAAAWLHGFDKVPPNEDPYADIETTSPLAKATSQAQTGPVSVTQTIQNEKEDGKGGPALKDPNGKGVS